MPLQKNQQNRKKGRDKKRNKTAARYTKNNKMTILSPCLSLIT